jgi:hypothetical protein
MPVMRRCFVIASSLLMLVGCSCEHDDVRMIPHPAPEVGQAPSLLPRATRDDLPAATPALTITVNEDGFSIDNLALVQSWPSADRARVENLYISGDFMTPGDTELMVPALGRALQNAAAASRSRSESAGTPIAYALRVSAEVPWRRVLQAIHTAGQAGFSEPRFVLRAASGQGEVMLALPAPPSSLDPAQALALEREIRALAESDPSIRVPNALGAARRASTHEIIITGEAAIELRIGDRTVCNHDAVHGAPNITALSECLTHIESNDSRTILTPDNHLLFGQIAPLLEMLTARGPIELGLTEPPRESSR